MLGACNTDVTFEPQIKDELIKRWHIHQLGRYKVATLGWLTPDTAFTAANVGKVGGVDVFSLRQTQSEVRVNPVVPAVKKCVADLKAEHPDVHMIIGLSHTGYNPDLVTAKAVPELDLIVGGHSHTFLKTPVGVGPIFDLSGGATAANCADERACDVSSGPYPTYVKTKLCTGEGAAKNCTNKAVPVVQAFYASKYIGDLVIDLASKRITSAKPVLLGGANSSNPVPQDPATLAAIERLAPPVQDLETESAGLVNVLMIGGRPGRVQETNFGSYLADIMIRAVKLDPKFEAKNRPLNPKFEAKNGPLNIAVTNSGSIRADIDPGEVTYGDVLTALPFRNTLAVKALTGEQLIGVFKHSVSLISEGEGLFLQVSGVRVFHRGDDLVAVKLLAPNGTTSDIDPAASYNVATIDFVANGGDGYESFKNAPSLLALGNEIGDIMFADLENNMPNAIKVPDVTKTRRIINCEATYVKCGNPVFGPCCAAGAAAPKAAAPKAAAPKGAAPKAAAKPPKTAP
ncbi:MAG: 5'-nucleotidase [Monoraphidium minutum]|nr:MAG: 5'-nucleotidase [Monoraphidium minutum]